MNSRHISIFHVVSLFGLLFAMLGGPFLYAQTVSRKVISTSGNFRSNSNFNVAYTIGEIVVTTRSAGNNVYTQGFQQPRFCQPERTRIRTTDGTTFCKDGSEHLVRFNHNGDDVEVGEDYVFVIADLEGKILVVINGSSYDFDNIAAGTYRVYGIAFEDGAKVSVGDNVDDLGQSGCIRVSDNFIPIEMSQPPDQAQIISPEDNSVFCGTDNLELRAQEPENGIGRWTGPQGVTFSPNRFATDARANNLPEGQFQLNWVVVATGCPNSSDRINVTNIPRARATILTGDELSTCSSNPVGLFLTGSTPAAGETGQWSANPSLTFSPNNSTSAVSISGISLGQTEVIWTINSPDCPPSRDTLLLINNEVQSVPQINHPDTLIVCADQITLNADPPQNGDTGLWSVPNNIQLDPDENSPTVTLRNIPSNQYIDVVWDVFRGNCFSGRPDKIVIFNIGGASAAEIKNSDQTICAGETITLEANAPGQGESGRWAASQSVSFAPNTSAAEVSVSELPPGEETVLTWTISSPGCPDNTDEVRITVIDPNTNLLGADTTLCKDAPPLALEPSMLNIESYSWSTGEMTAAISVDPDTGNTEDIVLEVVTRQGCTITDIISISRDDLQLDLLDEPICINGEDRTPASLNAGEYPNAMYVWSNGEMTQTIQVDEPGNYTVTVLNQFGCEEQASTTVVEDFFLAELIPPDTTIQVGDTIQLVASGGDDYLWSPTTRLSCVDCPDPLAYPTTTTTYTVEVYRNTGCQWTDKVTISISIEDLACETLFVPNVLTPGGNGFNDLWEIENLSPVNEVFIYDRWGSEVYHAKPYENNWRGTKTSGNLLVPPGTYFYVLYLNERETTCRGSITVIPDK